MTEITTSSSPKSLGEAFVLGCRQGLHLALEVILPRIIGAFVAVQVLQKLHLLDYLSLMAEPLMGLWGLPGEAAIVIGTAVLSNTAAAGLVVAFLLSGTFTAENITILFPGIYATGALVQFTGRVLSVIGIPSKRWPMMIVICAINSALALTLMTLVMKFFCFS